MTTPVRVPVTITSEVDPEWIDLAVNCNDLFMYGYCGYWMCGMEHTKKNGWLCYEFEAGGDQPTIREAREMPEYKNILKAWRAGEPLPEHWHRLDEAMAVRAWVEGVKRDGQGWYENGDANTYDCAMQMAMLGEIVYG
jgi:hypothetical protein